MITEHTSGKYVAVIMPDASGRSMVSLYQTYKDYDGKIGRDWVKGGKMYATTKAAEKAANKLLIWANA
jgi:hypothetical protein